VVDGSHVIHELVDNGTSVPAQRRRIGDLFVEQGIIDDQQLAEALEVQRRTGGRLGEILIELGFVTSLDSARVLAERLGMDFVDLAAAPVDEIMAQRIPEEIARRYRAIPIAMVDGVLRVAVADPTDVFALDDLQVITKAPIVPVVADPGQLLECANRIWSKPSMESRIDDAADLQDQEPEHLLVAETEDAPIIRLVDAMITQATEERASDIHIEPSGERVRIRFRVDGVLHDASYTPRGVLRPVVSRLKVMAGCDISNSRTPQDGRFTLEGKGREVDVRMTTLPTASGEAVVLRLLDKSQGILELSKLGFEADDLERYEKSYRASQGAILAAGPTGSGKTSTLYATLAELNDPTRSIVSVEDPVEYHMDGIKQMQVGRRGTVGFAGALRSILRADPDVILVGEIRDSETALIAAEAALTGHLVLSTIHTLSAATVPVRLIEMGVEPYLVTSSLQCVVSQRLARRLCQNCVTFSPATENEIEFLSLPGVDPLTEVGRPVGCQACSNTGYRGRLAIYEVMTLTDDIRGLIAQRAAGPDIERVAIDAGMRTLRVAGARRVREGTFGPDELLRVLS
jgi:Type II secretory pathway, ATPase PulE/Tfp pilus assembly pathway, ATPase PilB